MISKGRTFVCIIRESEYYSKYKGRPLKSFKQGSTFIPFIFKKITSCCAEGRLEEEEWGLQLKGS